MTLVARELEQLSGLIEESRWTEVEQIYLPLSRLLNLHVAAEQALHAVTAASSAAGAARAVRDRHRRLGRRRQEHHGPRAARAARRWADHPRVDLVTTDGFLCRTASSSARGLMNRKGFPESYDTRALLGFLDEVKSGQENVEAPLYSHLAYDVTGPDARRRPPRHPDRRGHQRAAAGAPARTARPARSCPTSSTSRSMSMRTRRDRGLVPRRASCACARRRSAIRRPTSIAMPAHDRRGARRGARDLAHHQRQEPATRTSCRPASAPAPSSRSAPTTASRAWRSAASEPRRFPPLRCIPGSRAPARRPGRGYKETVAGAVGAMGLISTAKPRPWRRLRSRRARAWRWRGSKWRVPRSR